LAALLFGSQRISMKNEQVTAIANQEYKWGFVSPIEEDTVPPGLNEDVIRLISRKKEEPDWLLEWRLKAYRQWRKMKEPTWQNVHYPSIDYEAIRYYSAPKKKSVKSLDEVDPEVRKTFERLGIPLEEQKILAGVAVDAVIDSASVTTTFKKQLAEKGIVFCSFSEAVREHPDLRTRTTSSPPSTAPSSRTAASPTSPPAYDVRWNSVLTSASTPPAPASSSAPSSSPTRAAT
jgi:Fe-S cluster assembly protein SufB